MCSFTTAASLSENILTKDQRRNCGTSRNEGGFESTLFFEIIYRKFLSSIFIRKVFAVYKKTQVPRLFFNNIN